MSHSSSRRRSRISHFKTPFIVSVAGPAAIGIACGGQADADDPNSSRSQLARTETKTETKSETKSETTGVPPEVPSVGMPCSEPESPLDWECGPNPRCVDGKWEVVYLACNPPPPSEECPAAAPEVGSSCLEFAGELTCSYEYCYDLVPMRRCDAATGLWEQVPVPTCNPPPPPPPVSEPCDADLPVGSGVACPPEANAPDGGT